MASWLPPLCPSVTMAHCLLRSWSDLCPWVIYQARMDVKGQPAHGGKRSLPQERTSPALPEPCSLVWWHILALQVHLFRYCPPNKQGSQGEEKEPGKFCLSTMSQVVLQNIPEIHAATNGDINTMVPPTATLHNRQQDQGTNQISKDCTHLSPRYHLNICLKKRAKGHNPS